MSEITDKMLEEKVKERMPQAKEMEAIWGTVDKETRGFLKGCMATVCAFASQKAE